MTHVTDESQAKPSKTKAALAAQREADETNFVMADPRGRAWVRRLLASMGVYRTSFNTNALQMAFNEGSRNQGLQLTAHLEEVCPDHFQSMNTEAAFASKKEKVHA